MLTVEDSFWTTNGSAVIGAVSALFGALVGGVFGMWTTLRVAKVERRRQALAALQAAVSSYLSAGADLVSACDTLVGMQLEALQSTAGDKTAARTHLSADRQYQRADRDLEALSWAAFRRQQQPLLVLPDVEDQLVTELQKAGDNAWGQAHPVIFDPALWTAFMTRYEVAARRLTEWVRHQSQ